jgi:serine protease Do
LSFVKPLFVLLVAVSPVLPVIAGSSTIHLLNGASIEGEILREKSDRVVIDLGFTVLSVPTDEIDRITADGPDAAAAESRDEGDVYHVAPGREELTVKENLVRCEDAVVEIRTPTGLGSGFIIHPSGYVVTNDHVIAGEHRISVIVFHKREQELQKIQYDDVAIVATNPWADLALLKINDRAAPEFDVVPLGDSGTVRQGQPVFAVGSPLGFERSVSEGIVSLRNRPIDGRLFIQSTAQLNPGNSGGPLFNLRGEVVGINNIKIVSAGVEGLSFSIVVDALKTFLRNRDAFAFDARNPNAGFRYASPPVPTLAADAEPVQ